MGGRCGEGRGNEGDNRILIQILDFPRQPLNDILIKVTIRLPYR
jgi:hypothetical protein